MSLKDKEKKSDSCYFILPVLHKLHIFGINTSNISSLFTTTLHLTICWYTHSTEFWIFASIFAFVCVYRSSSALLF